MDEWTDRQTSTLIEIRTHLERKRNGRVKSHMSEIFNHKKSGVPGRIASKKCNQEHTFAMTVLETDRNRDSGRTATWTDAGFGRGGGGGS